MILASVTSPLSLKCSRSLSSVNLFGSPLTQIRLVESMLLRRGRLYSLPDNKLFHSVCCV